MPKVTEATTVSLIRTAIEDRLPYPLNMLHKRYPQGLFMVNGSGFHAAWLDPKMGGPKPPIEMVLASKTFFLIQPERFEVLGVFDKAEAQAKIGILKQIFGLPCSCDHSRLYRFMAEVVEGMVKQREVLIPTTWERLVR